MLKSFLLTLLTTLSLTAATFNVANESEMTPALDTTLINAKYNY